MRFEAKGKADFVTEVDLAAERELIPNLQSTYPDHAICEESGRTGPDDAEHVWVIDPLDGTSNFMRGSHYAISMACIKGGKLEHAVIVDPAKQEEFTASRGEVLNSTADAFESLIEAICVSAFLAQVRRGWATATTVWIGMFKAWPRLQEAQWESDVQVPQHWIWLMWLLVDSTVSGKRASNPDIAAGTLLIRESGGLVTNFQGSDDVLGGKGDIVCANPKLLKQLAAAIR